jgi:hypothetical protein
MEKKEIEEGNKLIAEFMQFEYDRKDLVTGKILLGIEDCKYNSSWDWITPDFIHIEIPVVEILHSTSYQHSSWALKKFVLDKFSV